MRKETAVAVLLFLLLPPLPSLTQQWAKILEPRRGIDWSNSGVGGIPGRATLCDRLTSFAGLDEINAALRSCPAGQTVFLAAGTYSIHGTIRVPSNVTLRGAGANRTILNATGTGGGYVVGMGAESVPFVPVNIVRGATAGSTVIVVEHAAGISSGSYLAIAESNNLSYVTSSGSEGNCSWCDGWTKTGELSRGQIVSVTGVKGDTIIISPGLYGAYTNKAMAVPFRMAAENAGVEDLQVYANHTGYDASFGMSKCGYCWIKGVEANYTDGDPVEILWGFRDEVRDSYFSNSFVHQPGLHDSGIHIALKTSASLIENNILERMRISFDVGWGAAGNVIAYNYAMGEFVSAAPEAVVGGVRFHGAHPQFNLLEGNVLTAIDEDSIWGSSSHTTAFRNWVVGTNRICAPLNGRGAVNCSGANSHYGFQAARAIQISYLGSQNNFVGNVLGSAEMQALTRNHRPLAQAASTEYPVQRSYEAVVYGWSFGYGPPGDDGTGTGCYGGSPPCHRSETSSTNLLHANYNNVSGSTVWAEGISQDLPPSFYLPGKPPWWGTMAYPATGPDVDGGSGPRGHSFGNPARNCYLNVMRGSDGGAGGPLNFDAEACYGRGTARP